MPPLKERVQALMNAFLFGMCYAAPAYFFSQLLYGESTNLFQSTLPVMISAGTFLSAVIFWSSFRIRSDSLLSCACIGAVIGMVLHPMSMVLYVLLPGILDVGGGLLNAVTGRGWGSLSITDNMVAFGFLFFWWSLVAIFWIGWITAGVGALIGWMIGVIYRFLGSYGRAAESNRSERSPLRTLRSRQIALERELHPSQLIAANLVALVAVIGLTFLSVLSLRGNSQTTNYEVSEQIHTGGE